MNPRVIKSNTNNLRSKISMIKTLVSVSFLALVSERESACFKVAELLETYVYPKIKEIEHEVDAL